VKIKNHSGKTFHIEEYKINAPGGQTGDYNNNGVVDAADLRVVAKGRHALQMIRPPEFKRLI